MIAIVVGRELGALDDSRAVLVGGRVASDLAPEWDLDVGSLALSALVVHHAVQLLEVGAVEVDAVTGKLRVSIHLPSQWQWVRGWGYGIGRYLHAHVIAGAGVDLGAALGVDLLIGAAVVLGGGELGDGEGELLGVCGWLALGSPAGVRTGCYGAGLAQGSGRLGLQLAPRSWCEQWTPETAVPGGGM